MGQSSVWKPSALMSPTTPATSTLRTAFAVTIMRPPTGSALGQYCRASVWLMRTTAFDCLVSASVKNRPANGRVIFGDDYSDSTKTKATDKAKLPPDVKGFTGVKPPPQILPKRPPG